MGKMMWDKRLDELEEWKKERESKKRIPKHEPTERSRKIADMYESGKTLKEVGEHFNLSRERVRQILNEKHPEVERRTLADYYQGERVERIEKDCGYCGEQMRLVPSKAHKKYCSPQCFYNDQTKSPFETDTPEYKEWREQQIRQAQKRYYQRNREEIRRKQREWREKQKNN